MVGRIQIWPSGPIWYSSTRSWTCARLSSAHAQRLRLAWWSSPFLARMLYNEHHMPTPLHTLPSVHVRMYHSSRRRTKARSLVSRLPPRHCKSQGRVPRFAGLNPAGIHPNSVYAQGASHDTVLWTEGPSCSSHAGLSATSRGSLCFAGSASGGGPQLAGAALGSDQGGTHLPPASAGPPAAAFGGAGGDAQGSYGSLFAGFGGA